MNSNPLDSDPAREHRIRERAYHLWEADGRPDGRETEFWERARELVGMEDSAGAGLLDNPITHPNTLTGFPSGVEEAEIQENYGEFPDRLTDEGDREETPEARHSPRARRAAAKKAARSEAQKPAGSS
ncbi:MAG: DUF2934 domain-containing protein [Acetobacteraceae bacterium]